MPKPEPAEVMERWRRAKERYTVLSECVTMVEATRRRFSRNEAAQSAKEGYETAFEEEGRRLEVLREMMREVRDVLDECARLMY